MFLNNLKYFIVLISALVLISTSAVYGCSIDDTSLYDNTGIYTNSLDYVSINDADLNQLSTSYEININQETTDNTTTDYDTNINQETTDNTPTNHDTKENQKTSPNVSKTTNLSSEPVGETLILKNTSKQAGTFDELAELIKNLKPGDRLDLDRDYYITNGSKYIDLPITIDVDNITIDGHSHILDANNMSAFFYIIGKHVTIIDLMFHEGYYNSNRYTYDFSPIFWAGDYGTISGCSFYGNQAKKGGAITWSGNYGQIDNSLFYMNIAYYVGGALYILGHDMTLKTVTFRNSYSFVGDDVIFLDCGNGQINLDNIEFDREFFTRNPLSFPEINKYLIRCRYCNINSCNHAKKL